MAKWPFPRGVFSSANNHPKSPTRQHEIAWARYHREHQHPELLGQGRPAVLMMMIHPAAPAAPGA
jgi:hypothetical protein